MISWRRKVKKGYEGLLIFHGLYVSRTFPLFSCEVLRNSDQTTSDRCRTDRPPTLIVSQFASASACMPRVYYISETNQPPSFYSSVRGWIYLVFIVHCLS
jgi:hypothetical protein